MKKHRIITLCGSIRFKEWFDVCAAELTLRGWIVLGPEVWLHSWLHDNMPTEGLQAKRELDELHTAKIRKSQAIFVVDVLGYTGSSTKREISYAIDHGKEVHKWSRGDLFSL